MIELTSPPLKSCVFCRTEPESERGYDWHDLSYTFLRVKCPKCGHSTYWVKYNLEEPINEEITGTDFDTLWKLRCEKGYFIINWARYERKKGRAFGRWDALFCHVHEWKNNIKPWKIVVTSEETTISMGHLMKFDTEKVIQYLKERGITACPMNF